jgi:hypothetical protein
MGKLKWQANEGDEGVNLSVENKPDYVFLWHFRELIEICVVVVSRLFLESLRTEGKGIPA